MESTQICLYNNTANHMISGIVVDVGGHQREGDIQLPISRLQHRRAGDLEPAILYTNLYFIFNDYVS